MPDSGVTLALNERKRQLSLHSAEEDDTHIRGELAYAAISYLLPNSLSRRFPPSYWPWTDAQWKQPTDRRVALAKAAALCMAEIDRLNRVEEKLSDSADK